MKLTHGTTCCVSPRNGVLTTAKVVSHHPEAKAVKVVISGDEWILKESEVIPPGSKESDWPEWLKMFSATLRATRKKRKSAVLEVNKAEAARQLGLPYSSVLSICQSLQSIGVTIQAQ